MIKIVQLLILTFTLSLCTTASASIIKIQPDDAIAGKDMWANPSFGGVGDNEFLHVWKSAIVTGFKSLIQFPTNSFISAGNTGTIQSATLNLYVLNNEASNNSHAPGFDGLGIDINVSAQANPWTEITANGLTPEAAQAWNIIQPLGNIISSNRINAVNQWVSFEVTNTVKNWLNNSGTNNGFILESPTEVRAQDGQVIAAAFTSSGWSNATLRPFLEIKTIPSPTIIWLLGAGLLGIAASRRFHSKTYRILGIPNNLGYLPPRHQS